MKKFKLFLFFTTSFFMSYLLIYYIHVNYFSVDVVFYDAMLDGLIAVILSSSFLVFSSWCRDFCIFEKMLIISIWVLGAYSFSISIPTVIDRSLSIYILEKIQQRGGGVKVNSFENIFVNEYVYEHRLVDVRLTEQKKSGTISIDGGCVRLTDRGRGIVKFSRFFRANFLPKKRLLNGVYSDDLVDPFRNSRSIDDYEC